MIKYIVYISILMTPSFAYLDPGTGSMLLSTIIALFATVIFSVKSIFFKVTFKIKSLFGRKEKQIKKFGLVFYNEGSQYFSTFYPVLKELEKRGITFTYLYSDIKDKIPTLIKNQNSYFIGSGNKAFFYLNSLEAQMCIMTTPGLDVLQIKRSKGVSHYCHIHHATRGCSAYKVFGIDYYDSLLASCEYDRDFIRQLEDKRNLPRKDVRVVGTVYLDYALNRLEDIKIEKNNKKTILISPTWGEHGLLNVHGKEIIENLISNSNYYIIVRPHPQSVRYEQNMLEDLKIRFIENENIFWDYTDDGLESMYKSDLMISDFSGIIFDFIFLFSRPVISMPSVQDLNGKDYIDKNTTTWYTELYYKMTKVINNNDIDVLSNIIDDIEINKTNFGSEFINKLNPYFGQSTSKTTDEIVSIYNEVLKKSDV